jgi:hypothetical protein
MVLHVCKNNGKKPSFQVDKNSYCCGLIPLLKVNSINRLKREYHHKSYFLKVSIGTSVKLPDYSPHPKITIRNQVKSK